MSGDLLVWAGMTVLAVIFAVLGPLKLSYDQFVLRKGCAWAADLPRHRVQLIGVLETLAAVALVWPLATRTLTWLSPIAAIGIAALMVCAAFFHTRRGETELAGLCVLLGILSAMVAIGILF